MAKSNCILFFVLFFTLFISCKKDPTSMVPDPDGSMPKDTTADLYVTMLGKGFDVTYSEFSTYMELYREKMVVDFKSAGFSSVRIRIGDSAPDEVFMNRLKNQINDCLKNGIVPVIAYQGSFIEEIAQNDEEAAGHLVNWWRNMSEQLKSYPSSVSFNILIEISGTYKKNHTAINGMYVKILQAIRESNPTRIVIFPPVNLSNPDDLINLSIPGKDDPYTMAEWHFYAAGPSTDPDSKKYWIDGTTPTERNNVLGPIATAKKWMSDTGYKSWVGAWMAGNYNKGHEYDIPSQVAFASFMSRSLDKYDIPYCVNADNKFYDFEKLEWYTETNDAAGIPVRDAILDPNKIALYEQGKYAGKGFRLGEGRFDAKDLPANIGAIMVPFDYEVKAYPLPGFQGESVVIRNTQSDLSNLPIKSIEIKALNSY